jgi:hypothetical protein
MVLTVSGIAIFLCSAGLLYKAWGIRLSTDRDVYKSLMLALACACVMLFGMWVFGKGVGAW